MLPLFALLAVSAALPQDDASSNPEVELSPVEEQEAYAEYTQRFAEQLDFGEGTVALASGEAAFALPEGWAFLQARDARRVVEELWGNPPSTSTIGFIAPPSADGPWRWRGTSRTTTPPTSTTTT